jgi:hypothetical protein
MIGSVEIENSQFLNSESSLRTGQNMIQADFISIKNTTFYAHNLVS